MLLSDVVYATNIIREKDDFADLVKEHLYSKPIHSIDKEYECPTCNIVLNSPGLMN